MNLPKVTDEAYINFLIATPKISSATEAVWVQPNPPTAPAHDTFTHLLHQMEPDAVTLWQEATGQIERQGEVLVVDDSTLEAAWINTDAQGTIVPLKDYGLIQVVQKVIHGSLPEKIFSSIKETGNKPLWIPVNIERF